MDPQMLMMLMQAMQGGGSGGGSRGAGLAQLFSGLFGNSGAPYDAAKKAYDPNFAKATEAQNPFYNAGTNAIQPFQNMLGKMSNPTEFMNNLMSNYQESPWARYSQDQGLRAVKNLGSAGGLGGTGSTPLAQFAEQQAQGISSQDMQNWIGKVLGINTDALKGYGDLIGGGRDSANALTQLYGKGANDQSEFAYGREAGNQIDRGNTLGGLSHLFFG